MTQTLSQTPFLTLLFDAPLRVATLARSSEPPDSPRALEEEYLEALSLLSTREVRGVLIDSRAAVGRNSPEYEAAMIRITLRITGTFPRCAVLVQTATGALQARRMLSTAQSEQLLISSDLETCHRFLFRAGDDPEA